MKINSKIELTYALSEHYDISKIYPCTGHSESSVYSYIVNQTKIGTHNKNNFKISSTHIKTFSESC